MCAGIFMMIMSSCNRKIYNGSDRAYDTVNVGTTANDGTGDPIRTGYIKLNRNWRKADAADIDMIRLSGHDSLIISTTAATTVTMPTTGTISTTANIETRLQDKEDSATVGVSLATYQAGLGGNLLTELQAFGTDAIALPVSAAQLMSTNQTLADNTAYWVAFYLPVADTLTGVKFVQRTQGGYTADNYNGVALYSVSGTTYTKVASTTDDGNLWKATSYSLVTKAFSSTYVAAAGIYMAAFVYNSSAQTTAPNIYGWNGSVGVSQLVTGSHKIAGTVATQNTLPDSEVAADITGSDQIYGIWLY